MKTVLAFSGGLDSTVLLEYLLQQGSDVHCCIFTYGSKHNSYENDAAIEILHHYRQLYSNGISHSFFDLCHVLQNFNSNLLQSGGAIPEGHYQDKSMSTTVVPGRNLIFLSIMAGLAESIDAEQLAVGVHSGDHAVYPDCRPEFIDAAAQTIYVSSGGSVRVMVPFIRYHKEDIVKLALQYGAPLHLTRTCYKDQSIACGQCGACVERLEAFEKLNEQDKIPYAENE